VSQPSLGRALGLLAITLVLAAGWPAAGRAQDFSFYEVGARAASLGGSFTARADDATAIFYNPAGLAFLDGLRLKTNLAFGSRATDATRSDTGAVFPNRRGEFRGDHFAAWRPVRGVGVGLAMYSAYNFTSRWPPNWDLGTIAISTGINAPTLSLAAAVEPLPGLAVGASLDLVFLSVGWDHYVLFDLPNFPLDEPAQVTSFQSLKGHGLGYSVAALWKIAPWLRIGARYQAKVPVDLRGFNSFLLPNSSAWVVLPGPDEGYYTLAGIMNWFYTDQIVTGRLARPRGIACGVAVAPLRNLSLSFDLRWEGWSEFGRWEFRSVKEGGDLSPRLGILYRQFYGIEPDYGVQGLELALTDSTRLMAGAEYKVWKWFSFRAGFTRQASAAAEAGRSPLYPDPGFTIYSFGVGYEGPTFTIWDPEKTDSFLSLEFFVRYAASKTAASSHGGFDLTYRGHRFVGGLGIGFSF
jgi:long-chain fatty acid transport protein